MALQGHLAALYGQDRARAIGERLTELLRAHFPESAPDPQRNDHLPLSQRDVLVISYGDQVRGGHSTPLRTLESFLSDHLGSAVSGVHLLPFYPSSSDDGFAVIDYRSVDPAIGTWDDVSALRSRYDLMFDGVVNHVSAESDWFRRFRDGDANYRDYFIVVEDDPDLSRVIRPRTSPLLTTVPTASGDKRVWTTFGPDQIDNNVKNPDVLLELLDVLLLYIEHGAKFIRLDAIAYLWKEIGTSCLNLPQTHTVVQLLRTVLDLVSPDVMLITETNIPHRENLSYFGNGRNEAQLVYNFALPPLVLHSLTRGNAEALTVWADTLSLPGRRVAFLNFLASHDGIGVTPVRDLLSQADQTALTRLAVERGGFVSYKRNPDGTESPYELNINYLDALSDLAQDESVAIDRFLTAHAIMLAMPGLPAIYFHSLFGSRGDREGALASGIPRRVNRQKFLREDLDRELADPSSRRARILKGMLALLDQRRGSAAFEPTARAEVLRLDPRVFALRRLASTGSQSVTCLHNVSADTVTVSGEVLGPYQFRWLR